MGLLDGYHGWLHGETLNRATQIERIFRQEKSARARPDDEAVVKRLWDMVDKVGVLSGLPTFRPASLCKARPALMYLIYPAAVTGGVVAAILCK
jgi:hypothetical protein